MTIEGKSKIIIFALRPIAANEEITYNYLFPLDEEDKVPCLCGADKCRGFMN